MLIIMAVVRVLRTLDRRFRVEIDDTGRASLFDAGHLILRRTTIDRVGKRLAKHEVRAEDLVED